MDIRKGTRLKNRYEIVEQIGEGGFGSTYAAIDHLVSRFVAIKCSEQSLAHEAGILKVLDNVPHISNIYDYFTQDGMHFIVMRYVRGKSLSAIQKDNSEDINVRMIKKILPSIVIALDQMHDRGILHRDISPGNMMLTEEEVVYLIDFGAATSMKEIGLKNQHVFRHQGLDSPEYADESRQGPWTDVYSLCSTIIYLLTGEGIPDANARRQFDPVPSLLIGASLTARMQNALMKGVSVDAKFRYQTIRDFARDFLGSQDETVKEEYSVHYHAKTQIGDRQVNQDNFMVDTLFAYAGEDCEIKGYIDCRCDEWHIVALADGVTQAMHSELASKAAIQAVSHFIDNYKCSDQFAENLLEALMDQLNEKIIILGEKIGRTATTISVLLWKNDSFYAANIGDSPIYRLNGNSFVQLSAEHTVARDKIEKGLEVKPEDLHALSRYLGKKTEAGSQMACIRSGKIEKGDIFLLCSDGVARAVTQMQKKRLIKKDGDKAMKKIHELCAKRPGADNCTSVILKF